jgi:DNA repair protein RecN (Recombination protein N)
VLCITHLAPIAARGTSQFRIDKTVQRGRTVTSVTRLNQPERVEEIARMIGGAVVTESVHSTARDLLGGVPTMAEAKAKGERRK